MLRTSARNTDDGPRQEGTAIEIHLRGLRRVQKRKKWMIVGEISELNLG